MPRPTPQHGLNIQPPLSLSLSACSDTLYALATTGFPLCHEQCMCVFACINVLHVHPTVYLFSPPSSSCETGRKASIILMTITTCISICWPQMSRRAVVRLHSERAPKEGRKQRQETSGPLSGDPLPTQGPALSTPAHTQLQRHTDDSGEDVFQQWQQALDHSHCCFHCCTASQGSRISHILYSLFRLNFKMAKNDFKHCIYVFIHVIPSNVIRAERLVH